MARVDRAAKSARANFCAESASKLADACAADAKDPAVGPAMAPTALAAFFRAVAGRLGEGPVATADVGRLRDRVAPLLDALAHSGVEDSSTFNNRIDDLLKGMRDLLP
jgi:hypothetical protein